MFCLSSFPPSSISSTPATYPSLAWLPSQGSRGSYMSMLFLSKPETSQVANGSYFLDKNPIELYSGIYPSVFDGIAFLSQICKLYEAKLHYCIPQLWTPQVLLRTSSNVCQGRESYFCFFGRCVRFKHGRFGIVLVLLQCCEDWIKDRKIRNEVIL